MVQHHLPVRRLHTLQPRQYQLYCVYSFQMQFSVWYQHRQSRKSELALRICLCSVQINRQSRLNLLLLHF